MSKFHILSTLMYVCNFLYFHPYENMSEEKSYRFLRRIKENDFKKLKKPSSILTI